MASTPASSPSSPARNAGLDDPSRPADAGGGGAAGLLQAVTDVEAPLLGGGPAAPGRFAAHKFWLIRRAILPEALYRGVCGGGPLIPGLALRHLPALAVRSLGIGRAPAVVAVPSRADAIHVSLDAGRGRAFYRGRGGGGGDGLSVKVMRRGSPYEGCAAAELRARAILDQLKTLRVPRLYGHDLDGSHPYLAEQLVVGRRLCVRRDRALLLDAVFPQLCRTYRAYGVRAAPMGDYLEGDALDALQQTVDLVGWRAEWGRTDALLGRFERLLERNGPVAVSLGHGDVLPANLAVARGTGDVYFLDLERSCEMPVAFDLLLLGVKYWHVGYVREAIRRILRTEFPSRGYTVEEEIALYVGRRLAAALRLLSSAATARLRAERLKWLAHDLDICVRLLVAPA